MARHGQFSAFAGAATTVHVARPRRVSTDAAKLAAASGQYFSPSHKTHRAVSWPAAARLQQCSSLVVDAYRVVAAARHVGHHAGVAARCYDRGSASSTASGTSCTDCSRSSSVTVSDSVHSQQGQQATEARGARTKRRPPPHRHELPLVVRGMAAYRAYHDTEQSARIMLNAQ